MRQLGPMNISFISETTSWGGAEVHTVALADTLAERGHNVRLVALGHDVFDDVGRRPDSRFLVDKVPLAKPVSRLSYRDCARIMRRQPRGVGVLVRWGMNVGSLFLDLAAR